MHNVILYLALRVTICLGRFRFRRQKWLTHLINHSELQLKTFITVFIIEPAICIQSGFVVNLLYVA